MRIYTGGIATETNSFSPLPTGLAEEWGRRFFSLRYQVNFDSLPVDQALDKALACERRPVVLADQADDEGFQPPRRGIGGKAEPGLQDDALGQAKGAGNRFRRRCGYRDSQPGCGGCRHSFDIVLYTCSKCGIRDD